MKKQAFSICKFRIAFFAIIAGVFLSVSCMNDVSSSLRSIPTAMGKTNEIIVIADEAVWQSAVGDTFRYYFGAAYPIMPAPEPIFDIRHFTPEYFSSNQSRRELRCYVVLADINNASSDATKMATEDIGVEEIRRYRELQESPKAKVGRDRWAKQQLVAYILGNGADGLAQSIIDNFPTLANRINEHDEKQIDARTYVSGVHFGVGARVAEKYGVELKIPEGFKEVIVEDEFTWLRKDGDDATFNFLLYKMKYEDQAQLSKENIMKIRNELGEKYITSTNSGSYMVINDKDLPVFDFTKDINGYYAREVRGVWEMTEDFMGGPFFTWMILNENRNELIFIDAFVLAPGEDKRDFMQQLEHIVKKANFVTEN